MAYAKNANGIAVPAETHAEVADAEAVFGRIYAPKLFYFSGTRISKALDGLSDAVGRVPDRVPPCL